MNTVEIAVDVLEKAAEKGFAHLAEAAIESAGNAAQSWGQANDKIEADSESAAKDSAAAYDKAGKQISDSADKAQRASGESLGKIGERADQTASKASLLTGAFGALSGGAEALGLGPLATGLQSVGIATDTASGFADISAVSFEGLKAKFGGAKVAAEELGDAEVIMGAKTEAANNAANTSGGKNLSTTTKLGTAAAAAGVLITGLVVALQEQDRFQNAVKSSAQSYVDQLRRTGGAVNDVIRTQNAQKLSAGGVYETLTKIGLTYDDITNASLGYKDAEQKLVDTARSHGDAAKFAAGQVIVMGEGIHEGQKIISETSTATDGLSDSTEDMGNSFQQAATQMRPVDDILKELNGDTLDNVSSQLRLRDSLSGLKGDLDEHSKSLDENTDAGRKNKEAILDRIQSMNQQFTSTYQATGSIQQASAELSKNETALRNAAKAAGLNSTEVDKLIKKYGAIPKKVATQLTLDAKQAFATADTLMGKLDALKQLLAAGSVADYLRLSGTLDIGATGRGTAGKATGGPASGWTTVGENGIERVKLPNGSTVMSNPDTMASMGGGAPAPVVLQIQSSGSAVDDFLVEVLRRSVRVRGGDVQLVLGNGN